MSDEIFQAWYFDGKSAIRRAVDIQAMGSQIILVENEKRHGPFNSLDLQYVGKQDGAHIYGLEDKDGWRLTIRGEMPIQLNALLPAEKKYGGFVDRLGLGKASIALAIVSVAAVSVIAFTPQWLAPIIPQSWEQSFGDAMVGDFGGRFCSTEDGRKALAKMTNALDAKPEELQVEVAKIDMMNAVALPGGKVIIFQGLLDEAKSAEEVAGVLGHEIGHVRERHVMQSLIRQMGLSVIMGGADGMGGSAINTLLGSAYSRSAESEADAHSIAVMEKAEISPLGTAGFFGRLAKMENFDISDDEISEDSKEETAGDKQSSDAKDKDIDVAAKSENSSANLMTYISSHPLSAGRKDAYEKSAIKGKKYAPILTATEWDALLTMCEKDKDAKEGFGLFN